MSTVQVIDRGSRPPLITPPPLAATRELRAPLRRMPTELVVTTRMPPVKHSEQPATGVREVLQRHVQNQASGGRVPSTAHTESDWPPAAVSFKNAGHTQAYTAQTASHEELERAIEASTRTIPAAPRSDATAEALVQEVRRELLRARQSARQSEHRAAQAELRAVWAERFVPQMHDPRLYHVAQHRDRRALWLRRMLQIGLVGLVLGGYFALLLPLRDRVVAQNALIDQLALLQNQLHTEQRSRSQQATATTAPQP